ncbi:MAG: HNH endonuclease [Gallionella sp.]
MRPPSKKQYEHVLKAGVLSEAQLRALQALYNFPEHSATAPQLAAVLGYKGFGGANIVMGGAGKRISEELSIPPPWASDEHPNWFSIVADAVGTDIGCLWVMYPALASAFENTKLVDPSIGVDLFPDESAGHTKHEEGSRFRVEVNIYERSRDARNKCVSHYGARCSVCEFDFGSVYGALGKGFIHVHHLVPLAGITKSYIVDPVRDLRPVCPNCHAMIHRRNPAFSISEIKGLLKQ